MIALVDDLTLEIRHAHNEINFGEFETPAPAFPPKENSTSYEEDYTD